MLKFRGLKSFKNILDTRVLSALIVAAFSFVAVTGTNSFAAQPPQDSQNKNLDVRSSVGDLHIGADADAKKAGLPLYPGAHLKSDDQNSDKVNLGAFTEAFGIKLVVVKYESADNAAKVIDFYRDQLKKYGKVLECHTHEHGGNVHTGDNDDKDNDDKDDKDKEGHHHSQELKCEGDNSGPVTELKVGRDDNQHVVAVEPGDSGKGTSFTLVYVRTRGKQSDI